MRSLIGASLVGALVLIAGITDAAQSQFRITYHRERDEPSSIVLAGTVFNGETRDVVDVWLTAEALNPAGSVVATGLAFVAGRIYRHDSVSFVVKIPRVEGAHEFRLTVTNFRYGSYRTESP